MTHAQVANFSNEQALEQVRLYWANHLNLASGEGGSRSGGEAVAATRPAAGGTPSVASRGVCGLSSLSRAAAAAAAAPGNPSDLDSSSIGDRVGGGAGKDFLGTTLGIAVPLKHQQHGQRQQHQQPFEGGGAYDAAVAKGNLSIPSDSPQQVHGQHLSANASPQATPGAEVALRVVTRDEPSGNGGGTNDGNGHAVSKHMPAVRSRGGGRGVRRRSGSDGGSRNGREAATEALRKPLVQALHQIAQVG